MTRSAVFAALAFAAAIALPQAASAAPGSSQCIWDRLPAEGLEAYMTAAEDSDTPNPTDYISNSELVTALTACGITDANVSVAGGAFGAFTQRRLAERVLFKNSGVRPEALEQAWKRIDPATARQIAETFEKKDMAAYRALIEPAADAFEAAFAQPMDRDMVVRYVLSRADQEYLEATF